MPACPLSLQVLQFRFLEAGDQEHIQKTGGVDGLAAPSANLQRQWLHWLKLGYICSWELELFTKTDIVRTSAECRGQVVRRKYSPSPPHTHPDPCCNRTPFSKQQHSLATYGRLSGGGGVTPV